MTEHGTTPLTPRQLERLSILGRCLNLTVGDEGVLGLRDAITAAEWILDADGPATEADWSGVVDLPAPPEMSEAVRLTLDEHVARAVRAFPDDQQ